MTTKRLYLIQAGLILLLILAILIGSYQINSLLTSKANHLTSLKAKQQALSLEQVDLIKAKKDIAKYSSLNQIAAAVVPQDKNQAEATLEIVNIAAADNISLSSITFPSSSFGGSSSLAPSSSSTPVHSSALNQTAIVNSQATKLSQLTPVPGISGVYELPITIVSSPSSPVPYNQFTAFLSALEHNRRTAEISSIALTPYAQNRNDITFTLILNEFIKP